MDKIELTHDDNLGGLQRLDLIPLWQVQTRWPLTFYAGYDWITVGVTPETAEFSETTDADAGGDFQNVLISGSIPQIRPDVHAVLQKYRNKPCLVRTLDQNGRLRIAGTSAGRILLTDQSGTGAQAESTNGYQIRFAGKQRRPAVFV